MALYRMMKGQEPGVGVRADAQPTPPRTRPTCAPRCATRATGAKRIRLSSRKSPTASSGCTDGNRSRLARKKPSPCPGKAFFVASARKFVHMVKKTNKNVWDHERNSGDIIAAQALFCFPASRSPAGDAPQDAGVPPKSGEQTKSLTEVFIRAAQPMVATNGLDTVALPDTTGRRGDARKPGAAGLAAGAGRRRRRPDQLRPAGDHREEEHRPIIVIDLGHRFETARDSVDVGTTNKKAGLVEADIIDAVGARVIAMLGAQGFDVVQTRNTHENFQGANGDYKKSLSARGYLPAYLAQETGRPVVLLSIHVDNGRSGGAVYVQNDSEGEAHQDSYDLAHAIAAAYRIGNEGGRVNPGEDYFAGKGRFNNRMLRSFEAARNECPAIDGAATLLELGNIRNPADMASFHKLLKNPEPTAASIVAGLENFVNGRWPKPALAPVPTLQPVPPQNYLSQ